MVLRKDVHRAATELAERYGPLVKLRLMSFHVRTLPIHIPQFFLITAQMTVTV